MKCTGLHLQPFGCFVSKPSEITQRFLPQLSPFQRPRNSIKAKSETTLTPPTPCLRMPGDDGMFLTGKLSSSHNETKRDIRGTFRERIKMKTISQNHKFVFFVCQPSPLSSWSSSSTTPIVGVCDDDELFGAIIIQSHRIPEPGVCVFWIGLLEEKYSAAR